ncbi:MAG: hypothetical protein R3E63_03360 [Pseudomonadales bacterium]
MNSKPKSLNEARHEDAKHIDVALRRAADKARELAHQTKTPLVTVRDGQVFSEIPSSEKTCQ